MINLGKWLYDNILTYAVRMHKGLIPDYKLNYEEMPKETNDLVRC